MSEDVADGTVYFLLDCAYQRVKIGSTMQEDKTDRCTRQVVAGAGDLLVLGTTNGGRILESALHKQFAHWRVSGKREWFIACPQLWQYLATIGIAQPDVQSSALTPEASLYRDRFELQRQNRSLREELEQEHKVNLTRARSAAALQVKDAADILGEIVTEFWRLDNKPSYRYASGKQNIVSNQLLDHARGVLSCLKAIQSEKAGRAMADERKQERVRACSPSGVARDLLAAVLNEAAA